MVGDLLFFLEEHRISDRRLAKKVWIFLGRMKSYRHGLDDDIIERWQREENALAEIFTGAAARASQEWSCMCGQDKTSINENQWYATPSH